VVFLDVCFGVLIEGPAIITGLVPAAHQKLHEIKDRYELLHSVFSFCAVACDS